MWAGYTPSFPHVFSYILILSQCALYLPAILVGGVLPFLQPHSRWNICFLSLLRGWLYKWSIYVGVAMLTWTFRSWVVDLDVLQGLNIGVLPRRIWTRVKFQGILLAGTSKRAFATPSPPWRVSYRISKVNSSHCWDLPPGGVSVPSALIADKTCSAVIWAQLVTAPWPRVSPCLSSLPYFATIYSK